MSELEVKDEREDLPVFIHSELDDYGLSPVEFRVYARLARRCYSKPAFESVPNMAADFGVHKRTVQRSLRLLVECRLVAESVRPGKTTLYSLNPKKFWQHKSLLAATRERLTQAPHGTRDTRSPGGVTPGARVPVTPGAHEGSPNEGNPLKEKPRAPRDPSPAAEVFTHWLSVMEKKGARLTPEREKAVRARLRDGYTVEDIKQAIDGCRASPFHMGKNDAKKRYDDLTLICRNGAKLEDFKAMAERPKAEEGRRAKAEADLELLRRMTQEADDARRRRQERAGRNAAAAGHPGAYYCPPPGARRRES